MSFKILDGRYGDQVVLEIKEDHKKVSGVFNTIRNHTDFNAPMEGRSEIKVGGLIIPTKCRELYVLSAHIDGVWKRLYAHQEILAAKGVTKDTMFCFQRGYYHELSELHQNMHPAQCQNVVQLIQEANAWVDG